MGFFDSNSDQISNQTQETTNFMDYGVQGSGVSADVHDQSYTGITRSTVTLDRSNTTNIQAVDFGSVEAGAELARASIEAGADVSGRALDSAESMAGAAFGLSRNFGDSVERMGGQVIDFAARESSENRDFAYDTLMEVSDVYQHANDSLLTMARDSNLNVADAYGRANDAVVGVSQQAMYEYKDLAESSNDRVQDLAIRSMQNTGNAYSEATGAVLSMSRDASEQVGRAYERSNDAIYSISQDALSGYIDLTAQTADQVNEANSQSQSMTSKALDYVFQSTKDATERNNDTLIKWVLGGAAAMVGLFAFAVVRK